MTHLRIARHGDEERDSEAQQLRAVLQCILVFEGRMGKGCAIDEKGGTRKRSEQDNKTNEQQGWRLVRALREAVYVLGKGQDRGTHASQQAL